MFYTQQQENTQLVELIEGLRERQKKTTDTRLLDVETENKKLQDINLQLQSQVYFMDHKIHFIYSWMVVSLAINHHLEFLNLHTHIS